MKLHSNIVYQNLTQYCASKSSKYCKRNNEGRWLSSKWSSAKVWLTRKKFEEDLLDFLSLFMSYTLLYLLIGEEDRANNNKFGNGQWGVECLGLSGNASEKVKVKNRKYWKENRQGFKMIEVRLLIFDRQFLSNL